MHIAIDARFASGQKTGVGKYTFNLIKAVSKSMDENELHLFVNERLEKIESTNIQFHHTGVTPEMHPQQELWENIYLPLSLKRNKINIFHSPAFFLPLFTPGTKKIVTIHDLAVFKFPETFPFRFSNYLQFMIKLSVKSADKIIAVSNFVKDEIINILKVEPDKITVIYEGIDEMIKGQGSHCREALQREVGVDNFKETRVLTHGFILYTGTIEPRKNIINIIKSFNILKDKGLPYKLVLAGKKGWLSETIFEEVKRSRFKDDIILTGYIPDEELKLYYSACDVFVYPSLYEGFGLPPLEAMACGAPVVVSDIPVFRETLSESALFINPESPQEMADGIVRVLNDDNLRRNLKKKGDEQVKKFSWERTATETLETYKKVL